MSSIPNVNGRSHAGFCPVSSWSRNTREKPELMMPISEPMASVSTTKASATPMPRIRFLAKPMTLARLPPGSKFSPVSNIRQMPVNALSNSSIVTL